MGDAVTTIDDEPLSTSSSATPSSAYHTPAPKTPMTETSMPPRAASSTASRSKLRAILTWKDPKVSAAALLVCLVFYYLTLWKGYSILSVIGAGTATFLTLCLVAVNANKSFLGGSLDRFVKRSATSSPMFSTAAAYRFADVFVEEGNEFAEDARDVIYCENTGLTVAYIFVGVIVYFVGKSFSLLPVFFVFTLLAFTLPIAYEKNKKTVDNAVTQASAVASKHLESGRKVAVDRSYQLKDLAAERSALYLEKAPAMKNLAAKVGFTPSKKAM
jgi:Reticulon